MRVSLVTTWDQPCGIAEHSAYLVEALRDADGHRPAGSAPFLIEVVNDLHPDAVLDAPERPDVLHLNYHAALHSQWEPVHVRAAQAKGMKVAITYHDSGVPSTEQCRRLHAVADAFVVHEPVEDLPGALVWRQGVPDWQQPYALDTGRPHFHRPVVGTVGFPFGWKNYDLLCEAARAVDWGVLLIAPTATDAQIAGWKKIHPLVDVRRSFLPREKVIGLLTGCDATAFAYANINAGTSGAVRQGLAARKPVIASAVEHCRQFRDLALAYPEAGCPIHWVEPSLDGLTRTLRQIPIQRVDAGIVAAAYADRWSLQGERYAALYRSLVP